MFETNKNQHETYEHIQCTHSLLMESSYRYFMLNVILRIKCLQIKSEPKIFKEVLCKSVLKNGIVAHSEKLPLHTGQSECSVCSCVVNETDIQTLFDWPLRWGSFSIFYPSSVVHKGLTGVVEANFGRFCS